MKCEVEVKAKVSDSVSLTKKLSEMGCFLSDPIEQHDYIYNQKGIDLSHHTTPVLRIRVQGERTIFTFKQNRGGELDCIEKEVDVNSKETLSEIIELLGYEKTVEVHKTRKKGIYNDLEICLDDVKGLGVYIEVEKMTDEDGQKVQKELFDFLKTLGIKEEDRVMQGYDSQIYEKNKNL
ncbi:MAG: class IV adenylate cyclase [bacterium]